MNFFCFNCAKIFISNRYIFVRINFETRDKFRSMRIFLRSVIEEFDYYVQIIPCSIDETWTAILTIHQFYVQASININIITQNSYHLCAVHTFVSKENRLENLSNVSFKLTIAHHAPETPFESRHLCLP